MLSLLPDELIIQIFRNLDSKSLIALTKTSYHFFEIISSDAKMTKDFVLKFEPENRSLEWTGWRKYTRLRVIRNLCEFHNTIFLDISKNLTELQIDDLNTDASVLKEILLNTVNIKKLSLRNNVLKYEPKDFNEPLPMLCLKKFHYQNFLQRITDFLKILMNCQISDVNIMSHSFDCDGLWDFIKQQKHIQSLSLHDINGNSTLLGCDKIRLVDFRLKELILYRYSDRPGLQRFLQNHIDSLQFVKLWLVNQELLELFENFQNVHTLQLSNFLLKDDYTTVLNNIKELTIRCEVTGNWAKYFPNVQCLNIKDMRIKNKLEQIEHFEKLERLNVKDANLPEISIPTVKRLEMEYVGFPDGRPFKFENNNIESLKILRCTNVDWLSDFLKNYAKNLKYLDIEEIVMTEDCFNAVDEAKKSNIEMRIMRCERATNA